MTSELLLNLNTINELKDMLEENFTELFTVFKDNSREHIEQLKIAHAENNIDDVFKYTHILKGSCGSLGLTGIYDFMNDLETCLREDKNADVTSSMLELESLYSATLNALVDNGFLAT